MSEATILVERDGRYVDASAAALDMLGMTLEQLRALPPGSLAAEQIDDAERDARRAALLESEALRVVGAATLRRPDGLPVRVKFIVDEQPDGRFLARLQPSSEGVNEPTLVFTMGQVLAAWRAAERRLEELAPDSPEAAAVRADIDTFRAQYRSLSEREGPRTN